MVKPTWQKCSASNNREVSEGTSELLSFVLSFQKRKYIRETSFRKVLATYSAFFVAGKRGKRRIPRLVSNIKFPAGNCGKIF
ncbi:MAG: hypothetical protein EGQ30_01205 [Clostridiales bacterium]|nr:hypothetical protein [Clostridiales bacterium]